MALLRPLDLGMLKKKNHNSPEDHQRVGTAKSLVCSLQASCLALVLQWFWSTKDQYLKSLWSCIMMPCCVWQNMQDVAVCFSYRILPWPHQDVHLNVRRPQWICNSSTAGLAPGTASWLQEQQRIQFLLAPGICLQRTRNNDSVV